MILNALWVIANNIRLRKEQGEFKTFRDAYKRAVINISSSKVRFLTVQKLEKV
tara:strand:- start:307 stop:465 length:159 start_codon:yes stop_codon:yes gene_type:complete